MNDKKVSIYLRRALLSSIVVLMVGFLGFGVRAFSTPDLTRLVFAGVVVVSIGILALYFMRHRSARESEVYSLPREVRTKSGERLGAEAGVVRVEKIPDSRRAA